MSAVLAYIRSSETENIPLIPASWDMVIEADNWTTIYPLGRESNPDIFFHCRFMMRHSNFPGRSLFICTGNRTILNHLANRITTDALPWTRVWLTLQQLRDDVTTIATQIKANWPDERPLDEEGNPIGTLVSHIKRMAGFGNEDGESE